MLLQPKEANFNILKEFKNIMRRMFSEKQVEKLVEDNATCLYRHHFDIVLNYSDIPLALNPGEVVTINVNALSNDSEPWETLGELDGKGMIISAFGTVVIPSIDFTKVFELKLFYKAIETLLIDVHALSSHDVGVITAVTVMGYNPSEFPIEDSVSKI